MNVLIDRLMASVASAEVAAKADQHYARATAAGLTSDWAGSPKEIDFARLVVAIADTFPPGGSVETGVFKGGTSALLILSCAPDAFHVAIDPYGLPSQSYHCHRYQDWAMARASLRRLHELGESCGVMYCHYFMDSAAFVRNDLLRHAGRFNIVHLDGDHSVETVRTELAYFMKKLGEPAVFIMDDDDENNPGVRLALQDFRGALMEIVHKEYDFPDYGVAGFSAWWYGGAASLEITGS